MRIISPTLFCGFRLPQHECEGNPPVVFLHQITILFQVVLAAVLWTHLVAVSFAAQSVPIAERDSAALSTLRAIKTVSIIPLENHDLVQSNPTGQPPQLLGNPARPYFNSLTRFTGYQAPIAEGDNALSIIVPKIMASKAYRDHGVIMIWTDETESTDDTNTTLPFVVISPLAKGNAYASTLPYSHSSTLKTMDEIFGLEFQTNAIPVDRVNALNSGYDYVDGRSTLVHDLSDFFKPAN